MNEATTSQRENIIEAKAPIGQKFSGNPLTHLAENSIDLLNRLDAFILNLQKIIENDAELNKLAKDLSLIAKIRELIDKSENADVIMIKLEEDLPLIQKYDLKIGKIITDYLANRKEIGDVLRFIYLNLTPDGLRRLCINIDIVIKRMEEVKGKSLRYSIHQRLLLMKSIFNEISVLEKDEVVNEQKALLLRLIKNIENGIKTGTWAGFIGKGGFYTDLEYYMDLFQKRYRNETFARMLIKNKQRYGESQPEKWLGEQFDSGRFPDSLWYMYNNLERIVSERIDKLWRNAFRIGESLKAVIEQALGRSPSIALNDIKRRLDKFESKVRKEWEEKKQRLSELIITTRIKHQDVLNISSEVVERDNSFGKANAIGRVIKSSLGYEQHAQKLVSLMEMKGIFIHMLLGLAVDSKMLERNLEKKEQILKLFNESMEPDEELGKRLRVAVKDTLLNYLELINFIKSLDLGLKLEDLENRVNEYLGGVYG